jgi:spermidine synthase
MEWFEETHHPSWRQRLRIDRVLFRTETGQQDLILFENADFGRVLALDGVVQTTERDEFIYHESLIHTPVLAHGRARSLLIVGGGDGGSAREALKHPELERIVMVEIDPSVVELSKEHLPRHSAGAFDDPRLELMFADGARWVAEAEERFDVIVVDGTDPVGPGAVLYTEPFYRACRDRLTEHGVFAAQAGNPLDRLHDQADELRRLQGVFDAAAFFHASVPTYMGGPMLFAFGTRDASRLGAQIDPARVPAGLRHYTPDVHRASFALPPWFLRG